MSAINRSMKVIGSNGQVSLGKEFAGRLVEIAYLETGRFVLNLGTFVSDFEAAYLKEEDHKRIDEAIEQMSTQAPVETDINDVRKALGMSGSS